MKRTWPLLLVVLLAGAAFAGVALLGKAVNHSFLAGLGHPFFGLEHFLALIAVGLWAGRVSGPALWTWPLSFVLGIAFGFYIAASQPVPTVGPHILERAYLAELVTTVSLVLAALLVLPLPSWEATGGLMSLGMIHGYVIGAEVGAAALLFGVGLVLAAAVLQALGVGVGLSGPRAT